jgi:hypothetical protein
MQKRSWRCVTAVRIVNNNSYLKCAAKQRLWLAASWWGSISHWFWGGVSWVDVRSLTGRHNIPSSPGSYVPFTISEYATFDNFSWRLENNRIRQLSRRLPSGYRKWRTTHYQCCSNGKDGDMHKILRCERHLYIIPIHCRSTRETIPGLFVTKWRLSEAKYK